METKTNNIRENVIVPLLLVMGGAALFMLGTVVGSFRQLEAEVRRTDELKKRAEALIEKGEENARVIGQEIEKLSQEEAA